MVDNVTSSRYSDLALGMVVKIPHIDDKDLVISSIGTNSGDTTINSRVLSRGIGRGDVGIV